MAEIVANSLKEHRTGKPAAGARGKGVERSLSALVVVLFASLMVLTVIGIGTRMFVSLIGIAICIACLFRREVHIDWWIFIPLAVYVGMNMVSSYITYGTVLFGYGTLHLVFITLYAASCCLKVGEANLLRLLAVLWAAFAAVAGIIAFVVIAFSSAPTRLDFVVGSPNGLGIFFVLSWFALQSCRMSGLDSKLFRVAERFEPVILLALGLTLSMGSLAALVIGLVVLAFSHGRAAHSAKAGLRLFTALLPKVLLSVAMGILMYMSAERAEAPILCTVILVYLVVMMFLWKRFSAFLENNAKVSIVLSVVALLCIPLIIFMRPSAIATFSERIAMMANGISYLFVEPITGLGPMQWRAYNLIDSDMYFNTNHIHNIYIHAGVEFGLLAMIALIVITVRVFVKRYKEAQHGEDAAFLAHMMTDTGFFYVGVVGTFILTAGGSITKGKKLGVVGTKLLFAVLAVLHIAVLWMYLASF